MAIVVEGVGSRAVPWVSSSRGNKADRTLRNIDVAVLPRIAQLRITTPGNLDALTAKALVEIVQFDTRCSKLGIGISPLMVKTEAIASSRFEYIVDTDINVLKASVGQKVSDMAVEMAAGTRALGQLVAASGKGVAITQKMINDAHYELFQNDSHDGKFAGKLRTFQNWIEGSNKSPAGASYIPPEPDMVPGLMLDLFKFVNRNDLNPIVQAAIAHAQFESIHPYADGNGRIGRALISSMLIRAGVATTSVVPLAAALLQIRTQYVDALTAYRAGDAEPIVRVITAALHAAASVGLTDIEALGDLPADIQRRLKLVPESVTWNVVNLITSHPTLSADESSRVLGISLQSALNAIATLENAGVLIEITGRKRERHWVASQVLDLLSDYADRTGVAVVALLKRKLVAV